MYNKMINQNGFTLIETIIAMIILVIGIMSLYTMQISSIEGNTAAIRITLGTSWAQDQVENIMLAELKDIPAVFTAVENGVPVYTQGNALPINAAVKTWDEIIKLDNTNDGGRSLVQDTNRNGFDDDAVDLIANFGLDNTAGPPADFARLSPDGRFTIFYNFAIDVPLPRVVTIRIIVQENNTGTAPIVLTYIKDYII